MAKDDGPDIPDESEDLEIGLIGDDRERWLALQPKKAIQERERAERSGKKYCNPAARAEILGNAFVDHLKGVSLD
jgi:hypothetical protein